ncbi:hypothetical protein CJI97_004734 [Candidozyma auris]|uniref:GOLD domain-containing protein n=1 Tax=Candidozyma auris TaxID=498019 RepID=A0A2H0ZGC6_CANAR|nr:hypothetical_protein [[Candida] auris]PIS49691.1 hypothetical protein B9J08_004717 [[Candida] auris]PIS50046.1 hypothetical protein CJI97_004734 [[Candida] auris]QEO23536.1 hypothetical_protein [[Candida] auris]GBL51967.1 hypothetical protein CAJCM15448_42410 [[Candida] auris]
MHCKSSFKSWVVVFSILVFSTVTSSIGITVPAISSANVKSLSSSRNLLNCVGYRASKDDLIFVHLKTGERQTSQKLNLRVLDCDNNVLRAANDIVGDLSFIFTNLNSPLQIADDHHFNFLDRFNPRRDRARKDKTEVKYGELLDSFAESSLVYICFDNVFYDRSWSFKQQTRDIDLRVQIKNASTVSNVNYNEFAKYFSRISLAEDRGTSSAITKLEFTEEDFEEATSMLTAQLDKVSEQLKSSERILNTLKEHESHLRDVNEAIFAKYTTTSIAVLLSIVIFGLLQITFFKVYLKRKRIL